jgi:hypothetical protein
MIEADEAEVIAAVKDGHIVAFSQTEAALAELALAYGNPAVFDVTTDDGMKAAKAGRKELMRYRTSLEAKRKELKAPILARGKLLDDEAKRITAELAKLEGPLDAHITAEETRIAEAVAAAERAEAERVAELQSRLARIREVPRNMIGAPLEGLKAVLVKVEESPLDDYEEFTEAAKAYRESSVTALKSMIEAAELAERQAAELEALRIRQAADAAAQKVKDDEAAATKKAADDEIAALRAQLAAAQVVKAVEPEAVAEAVFGAAFVRDIEPETATPPAPEVIHFVERTGSRRADDLARCIATTNEVVAASGGDEVALFSEAFSPNLNRRAIIGAVAEAFRISDEDAEQEIICEFRR